VLRQAFEVGAGNAPAVVVAERKEDLYQMHGRHLAQAWGCLRLRRGAAPTMALPVPYRFWHRSQKKLRRLVTPTHWRVSLPSHDGQVPLLCTSQCLRNTKARFPSKNSKLYFLACSTTAR